MEVSVSCLTKAVTSITHQAINMLNRCFYYEEVRCNPSSSRPSDPLVPFGGYPKLEHSHFDFKMKVMIISTFQSFCGVCCSLVCKVALGGRDVNTVCKYKFSTVDPASGSKDMKKLRITLGATATANGGHRCLASSFLVLCGIQLKNLEPPWSHYT